MNCIKMKEQKLLHDVNFWSPELILLSVHLVILTVTVFLAYFAYVYLYYVTFEALS
jgi:hypothetical protein